MVTSLFSSTSGTFVRGAVTAMATLATELSKSRSLIESSMFVPDFGSCTASKSFGRSSEALPAMSSGIFAAEYSDRLSFAPKSPSDELTARFILLPGLTWGMLPLLFKLLVFLEAGFEYSERLSFAPKSSSDSSSDPSYAACIGMDYRLAWAWGWPEYSERLSFAPKSSSEL